MSDAFAGINYGDAAQNVIEHAKERQDELAQKVKQIRTTGTIEQTLGSAKILITGKKISEETVKALKPYAKQQLQKGVSAVKKEASDFAEKWGGRAASEIKKATDGVLTKFKSPTVEPATAAPATSTASTTVEETSFPLTEGAAPASAVTSSTAVEETSFPLTGAPDAIVAPGYAAGSPDLIPSVARNAKTFSSGTTGETVGDDLFPQGAAAGTETGIDAAAPGVTSSIGVQETAFPLTDAAPGATKAIADSTKAVTDAVKSSVVKTTGEEVAADAGEAAAITGGEAVGAVLDAIPVLNVLGLLIGVGTAAAGAAEMKHKPKMPPMPMGNISGSSFQVGVN